MKIDMPKILKLFRPVLVFIDHVFTMPHSIKKMKGLHYYIFRDRVNRGDVFITDIDGVGSNLVNPSDGKHAAIYFGFNLKKEINEVLHEIILEINETRNPEVKEELKRAYKRIQHELKRHEDAGFPIHDDVAYVIEAVGKGVIATDLVEFITSKDKVRSYRFNTPNPKFANLAPRIAIRDLGLPYDYGFAGSDESKYCFEVCADAYASQDTDRHLNMTEYKLFGLSLHKVYLATTFTADSHNWKPIIDSKKEFPKLYL